MVIIIIIIIILEIFRTPFSVSLRSCLFLTLLLAHVNHFACSFHVWLLPLADRFHWSAVSLWLNAAPGLLLSCSPLFTLPSAAWCPLYPDIFSFAVYFSRLAIILGCLTVCLFSFADNLGSLLSVAVWNIPGCMLPLAVLPVTRCQVFLAVCIP
jgi:hypothetical protein